MIRFAEVKIGDGPSTTCARCAARLPAVVMRDRDTIAAGLREIAAKWCDGVGPNVAFTGAEPFAHPDLPALIGTAVQSGFSRVRLDTDAGALSVAGNAPGVIAAGVRHINVMMLASGEAHDTLSARPGLYTAVVAGVAAFLDAAASAGVAACVTGRVPVCVHNVERVCDAVSALASMGAVSIELDGLGSELSAEVVGSARETAVVQQAWLDVPGTDGLPAPIGVLEVRS